MDSLHLSILSNFNPQRQFTSAARLVKPALWLIWAKFNGFLNLLAIGGKGSLRNAAGIVRIFLDFSGKLIVKYYNSTNKDKEVNLPDEIPQGADRF
jgi:hypothetical protein